MMLISHSSGYHRESRPRRRNACLLLALLLAMPLATIAADKQTSPPGKNDSVEKAPKCVHGCERWGKVCNVDPRGVYKCRRLCEKFGEICE